MPASKDRLIQHIAEEYKKKGYSEERAMEIAYGTVTNMEKEKDKDGESESNDS